mmetsp:Transcript_30489/g.82548  ORF Transcript_30489/g.82548 Transcript_30489/m.82548 type:complete len:215 (+) Transcript_30489:463-1107(+)
MSSHLASCERQLLPPQPRQETLKSLPLIVQSRDAVMSAHEVMLSLSLITAAPISPSEVFSTSLMALYTAAPNSFLGWWTTASMFSGVSKSWTSWLGSIAVGGLAMCSTVGAESPPPISPISPLSSWLSSCGLASCEAGANGSKIGSTLKGSSTAASRSCFLWSSSVLSVPFRTASATTVGLNSQMPHPALMGTPQTLVAGPMWPRSLFIDALKG